MDDTPSMTSREAIIYVKDHFGVPSKYALAKSLSDEVLRVQAIQIDNYLRGTRMSGKVADRFFEVYGVIVSDAYRPSDWVMPKE